MVQQFTSWTAFLYTYSKVPVAGPENNQPHTGANNTKGQLQAHEFTTNM